MNAGDCIRMTHFRDTRPGIMTDWKAPKGKVFVAILLGIEDKESGQELDIGAALRLLGWNPSPALRLARPDLADELIDRVPDVPEAMQTDTSSEG